MEYDFGGYATRNDLLCGDGRTIRRDAFKDNDGQTVPVIWNHDHSNQDAVLGHALLENRSDGVYAYVKLNDTDQGKHAKELVQHGDVRSLSIYANKLKHVGSDVIHGCIRELSLVLAGANPGAYIDYVAAHGDDGEDGVYANWDENAIVIIHSEPNETNKTSKEDPKMAEEPKESNSMKEKTVQDVVDSMTEEQRNVMYAIIGQVLEDAGANDDEEENNEIKGGNNTMKHNVFDNETEQEKFLSHSDEMAIIKMAKETAVGSFQKALSIYADENHLQHDAFDADTMELLLPEYQLIDPKEPKILYADDGWVSGVINGVHKSPVARIRTRRADARQADLKAKGYKKGDYKAHMNKINLLGRTHDAQTIFIKDALNRDDILDITDFDIIAYNWKIMRHTLDQTLAQAILIGDLRDPLDPDKIKEDHIRPIWKDDDMYCIHYDIDIEAARDELQGTETAAHFGDNYIYAEAVIQAALYSRENYKGSGNLTFYCAPHLLNVMLLARDLNGRRIYSSKNDLIAALNVKDIQTVEQFEGLTRTTDDGEVKKLLGLFVNLSDYQLGCVRGGEITKFNQFDMDFNQEKMLIETRVSGALVEWYSAIALEEPVETP